MGSSPCSHTTHVFRVKIMWLVTVRVCIAWWGLPRLHRRVNFPNVFIFMFTKKNQTTEMMTLNGLELDTKTIPYQEKENTSNDNESSIICKHFSIIDTPSIANCKSFQLS